MQARLHPELFLTVGDLGYSVIEDYAAEFPDRYLNAGVAEQNMTGVAAGLASEGYHVFTYSIANFPTLRCLEQIRNDICYHNLPVVVVAVGAGLAYGPLGFSHHGLQDIAILRTLPGMRVLSPADPGECRACLHHALAHPGPTYLRLGKAGETPLHEVTGLADGPLRVREGDAPVALVATGSILKVTLEAAALLAGEGIHVPVYSCPLLTGVAPGFFDPLWKHPTLVTLEEHCAAGGFGSLLRELAPRGVHIVTRAVEGVSMCEVGSQNHLRARAGLTGTNIAEGVRAQLALP